MTRYQPKLKQLSFKNVQQIYLFSKTKSPVSTEAKNAIYQCNDIDSSFHLGIDISDSIIDKSFVYISFFMAQNDCTCTVGS